MKSLLTLLTALWISTTMLGQNTLISFGSNWSYYDAGNEPSNQGSLNWTDVAFDDNSWSSGNAHLGYGDGDEVTTISSATITAYYRKTINLVDPSNFSDLDLDLVYDDGAVVYVNGSEVWRVNMPGGTITYNTFSSSTSSDNALATSIIANSLVSGDNTIAIEIHQRSSSSSDLSFDFKMEGLIPGQVSLLRGPYLQKGTENTMTIKWRTSAPTESIIDYGTTEGSLTSQVSDLSLKTEHSLEITGLSVDTKYYYSIFKQYRCHCSRCQ